MRAEISMNQAIAKQEKSARQPRGARNARGKKQSISCAHTLARFSPEVRVSPLALDPPLPSLAFALPANAKRSPPSKKTLPFNKSFIRNAKTSRNATDFDRVKMETT